MKVSVAGLITTLQHVKKDEKEYTDCLLVQEGELQQVRVRLPGNATGMYSTFEKAEFIGRLMAWKTRDGIGMMVLADG